MARLLCLPYDGDEHSFTASDRATIILKDNKIYSHKVLRVNYTTYDVRRGQDSINPTTLRRYVMLAAHDNQTLQNSHPFWYAQVLGIFHTWVVHTGQKSNSPIPRKIEFLWIRWLGPQPGHTSGWRSLRLDRVGFITEEHNTPSFGFLDPTHVIRGAHLIPAFVYGQTNRFLGPSLIRRDKVEQDWASFYVNRYVQTFSFKLSPSFYVLISCRFVDRDMFMRYFGGGVGHRRQASGASSVIHWQASKGNVAPQETASSEKEEEGIQSEMVLDSDEELDSIDPGEDDEESDDEF